MNIEETRKMMAENAGRAAEAAVRTEIRVGMAKDVLIPAVTRFTKELSENLKPINNKVIKALTPELLDLQPVFTGDNELNPTYLMSLGGLHIYPPKVYEPKNAIRLCVAYSVINQDLFMLLFVRPRIKYDDNIWSGSLSLEGVPAASLDLKDGDVSIGETYKVSIKDHEINVLKVKLPMPLADGEMVYSFLKSMWNIVGNVAFEVHKGDTND